MTQFAVDLKFQAPGIDQKLRKLQGGLQKGSDAANKLQGNFDQLTGKVSRSGQEIRKAAGGLEYFIDKAGRARKVNGQFVTSAEAAANGIKKFDRSARSARSGVSSLIGTLGKLALAYGAVAAAQKSLQAGIQRTESERRIKFLAKEYGEVAELSAAASDAAKRFGLSQTEANKALATTYARLRPVGTSLKDIESVYAGFNTAVKLSGASATEASGAFRQLAQGLGSGTLRGDEFNSVAEQVPMILTAVSKETGIAQGKLRDYAAEGKITADVVIRALKRIEKEGADQLTEAMGGPEQAIKDFQNATEDVQVALTGSVIPELANAFRELAVVIRELEPAIKFIGGLISNTLTEARLMIEAIKGGGNAVNTLRAGKLPLNVQSGTKEFEEFFGKERYGELVRQAKEMAKATGDSYAETLKERLTAALNVIDRTKEIQAKSKRDSSTAALEAKRDADIAALRQTLQQSGTGTGTGTSPSSSSGVSKVAELSNRERLLAAADAQLGNLAGVSEQCANAMRDIFKAAGINVGTSLKPYDQSDERGMPQGSSFASSLAGPEVGQRILLSDLKPGDLIAFENTYGNYGKDIQTHVGMYAGDGMMYDHSSSKGLTKRSVDTFSSDKQMYGIRPHALASDEGGDAFTSQLASMNEETERLKNNLQAGRDAIAEMVESAEQVTQGLQDQFDNSQLEQRLQLEGMTSQQIGIQVERANRLRDIERSGLEAKNQLAELASQGKITADQQLTTEQQITAEMEKQRGLADGLATANMARAQNATTELTEVQQLSQSIGETLQGGIVGALTTGISALASGAEDLDKQLQQILQGVLSQIANQLINFAMKGLFGGGGFGGFFADGGILPGNSVSVVGEEGPELAVNAGGRTEIIPMDKAMGRYSMSNGGASKGGSSSSGEVASAEGSEPQTFRLETTVINGVEYATVDQVRAMGDSAAKRGAEGGKTKTLGTLRNSRSQRAKLGLNR